MSVEHIYNHGNIGNAEVGVKLSDLMSGMELNLAWNDLAGGEHDVVNESTENSSFNVIDNLVNHNEIPFSEVKNSMNDTTESGKIKKLIVKNGSGSCPINGPVYINYSSYVSGDAVPFDSSYSRSVRPEIYRLGVGELYEGFEEAIRSMKSGEHSYFLIPPELAFKSMGVPPRIPKNATIYLQIELIKIGAVEKTFDNKEGEHDKKSFNDVTDQVRTLLITGKFNFERDMIAVAVKRNAEAVLLSCRLQNDCEEMKWKKLLLKVYINLAVCYNQKSYNKPKLTCLVAKEAFEEVPELALHNPKFLYQLAKAKICLQSYNEAEKHLSRALIYEPFDRVIKDLLEKVRRKIIEREELDKVLSDIDNQISFRHTKRN